MPAPRLSLVGAGPGDPGLITLKAVRTIGEADVILYDALANKALLEHASGAAIIRFTGKRYGCHALSQQEINRLIVSDALAHGHVVRLKGGDPFVFGRAVEEIEAARKAGIPVQVVPGISSALAVPASCMIPLTARGIAGGFWVTTGTDRDGGIPADVHLAARSTSTVIILMAMSRLQAIMDIFIQQGKGEVPAAIIEQGTTERERTVTGTVRTITCRAMEAGMANPAVIVVGAVVGLRTALLHITGNLPENITA